MKKTVPVLQIDMGHPTVHWPVVPPWILPTPEIDLTIFEAVKSSKRTAACSDIVGERLKNTWGSIFKFIQTGPKTPNWEGQGSHFAYHIWGL